MSQNKWATINPLTTSGTALAGLLNDGEDALHTNHSGATAPSYVQDGMTWLDTSTVDWKLMLRNGGTDYLIWTFDDSESKIDAEATIAWGDITGLLNDQTDLANALNAKYDKTGGLISGNVSVQGAITVHDNNIQLDGTGSTNEYRTVVYNDNGGIAIVVEDGAESNDTAISQAGFLGLVEKDWIQFYRNAGMDFLVNGVKAMELNALGLDVEGILGAGSFVLDGVFTANDDINLASGVLKVEGVQPFAPEGKLNAGFYIIGDSLSAPNGGDDGEFDYDTNSGGTIINPTVTVAGTGYGRNFIFMVRDGSERAYFDITVNSTGNVSNVTLKSQTGAFTPSQTNVTVSIDSDTVSSWAYTLYNSYVAELTIDAANAQSIAVPGTEYVYAAPPATPDKHIAIIQLGTNDTGAIDVGDGQTPGFGTPTVTQAMFETAYQNLIQNLLDDGYRVTVVLNVYNDLGSRYDTATGIVRGWIQNACDAKGITEIYDVPVLNQTDLLHPDQDGHDFLARDMYQRMVAVSSIGNYYEGTVYFGPNTNAFVSDSFTAAFFGHHDNAGGLTTGLSVLPAQTDLVGGGTIKVTLTDVLNTLVGDTTISSGGTISVDGGDNANPAYTFNGDPDTGIFSDSAGAIQLSANANEVMEISAFGHTSHVPINVPGQTVNLGYTFSGDLDTGMRSDALGTIQFMIDGSEVVEVNSGAIAVTGGIGASDYTGHTALDNFVAIGAFGRLVDTGFNEDSFHQDGEQVIAANGSLSSPGIRFSNDTNTGFFTDTVGQIQVTLNGTEVAEFANTALVVTGAIGFSDASGYSAGDNFLAFGAFGRIVDSGLDENSFALASHVHDAGDITTGTLAVARGGTGVTSSTGTGSVVLNNAPDFTGTVNFASKLEHTGDPNTYINFNTDEVEIFGGGVELSVNSFGISLSGGLSLNGLYQIADVADPTAGNHVGDRDYNDGRYVQGGHVHDAAHITTGTLAVARGGTGTTTSTGTGSVVLSDAPDFTGTVNVATKIEHTGDSNTYINFNTDETEIFGGGVELSINTFGIAALGPMDVDGHLTMGPSAGGVEGGELRIRNQSGSGTGVIFDVYSDTTTRIFNTIDNWKIEIGQRGAGIGGQVSLMANNTEQCRATSGGFRAKAGTSGVPSIAWIGNGNTGFYQKTTNETGVVCGGTRVAHFNSAGIQAQNVPVAGGKIVSDGSGSQSITNTFGISACTIYTTGTDRFRFTLSSAISGDDDMIVTATAGTNIVAMTANWSRVSDTQFDIFIVDVNNNVQTGSPIWFSFMVYNIGY